jgi:hypothetical protein
MDVYRFQETDSVRREVLYNILTEFGIPRLIKMFKIKSIEKSV